MAAPYEVPAEMRDFAEKSVDQARKAFEGFIAAAQKTASTVEGSAFTVPSSVKSVGEKAMSFAEANVKAGFDLAQKLVHSKDIQEVMTLQTEFVKTQMAAIEAQSKEIGAAVQAAMTPKA